MPIFPGVLAAAGGVGALYAPVSVEFDGATRTQQSGTLIGAATDSQFTAAVNCRVDDLGLGTFFQMTHAGGSATRFRIRISSGGAVDLFGRTTAGVTILSVSTTTTWSIGTYLNILITIDSANQGNSHIWVNGVDEAFTGTFDPGDFDFLSTNGTAFGGSVTTIAYNGSACDFWFDPGVLVTAGDIGKFFTAGGCVAWKGANGELPTGTAPLIYFSHDGIAPLSTWGVNKGTGGGFSVTDGALTLDSSPPCGGPLP